jgi:ADP-ribose pyrophosphatase YjhB (NUDIX family)
MITCTFENGGKALLRHVVTHAIVEKDGALLLVKRAGPVLETGKWGLPAGFLDRDETAGKGILRELLEETGWRGEIISLFRINSKPDRPKEDRQNVALDFLVKPIEKIGEPDHESSKVEWIPIEKLLPLSEFAFDHGKTIALYLKYRTKAFPIPILD